MSEKTGDEGWAERLYRDVIRLEGHEIKERAESIIMSYFTSVRRDERRLALLDLAHHTRKIAEGM